MLDEQYVREIKALLREGVHVEYCYDVSRTMLYKYIGIVLPT